MGRSLRAAQNDLSTAPWLAFFPGLCIFLTILSVNYVGDGLRDALDPRAVQRSEHRAEFTIFSTGVTLSLCTRCPSE